MFEDLNWYLLMAIVYAVASELIGISKYKSNSVVQAVMRALGKFFITPK